MPYSSISLIGMPGAGKSTVGVLLAKALTLRFVDTDLIIQSDQGRRLSQIILESGIERFLEIEEAALLMSDFENSVVATGGSAVYSEPAMKRLKGAGPVVWLKVTREEMEHRVGDPDLRGVVRRPGQILADLYHERLPLYQKWASHSVECSGRSFDEIVRDICAQIVQPSSACPIARRRPL